MSQATARLVTGSPPAEPHLRPVPEPSAAAPANPPPKLEIPSYDFSAALALERELGVSHVLAQILVRRGIATTDAARAFLDAHEHHDPEAFAGIEHAVLTI